MTKYYKLTDEQIEYFKLSLTIAIHTMKSLGQDTAMAYEALENLNNPFENPGTYIDKVEIQVNSNQDPSRIARLTAEELEKMSKKNGS